MKKTLVLIGTDHRIQHSVTKSLSGAWTKRTSPNFSRLIKYCIEKLGAQVILEEVLPEQEEVAPTICSQIAKESRLSWKAISAGDINVDDALYERPVKEYMAAGIVPLPLAGRYRLPIHKQREAVMADFIGKAIQDFDCVLVVVGYAHLAVLAHLFDGKGIDVQALMFMYPLVVDECLA